MGGLGRGRYGSGRDREAGQVHTSLSAEDIGGIGDMNGWGNCSWVPSPPSHDLQIKNHRKASAGRGI